MIPSSRVKFHLISMSTSWFFGADVFDFDFGVQINSIEQPIKGNSVGFGNVSHCKTFVFIHFNHSFIVLKHTHINFSDEPIGLLKNNINVFHHIDFQMRLVRLVHIILKLLRSI